MKIAIQNWIVDTYKDDEEKVKTLGQAGFTYVDWDLTRYYPKSEFFKESKEDVIAYASKLKAKMDEFYIRTHQTHTLFPTYAKNMEDNLIGIENCFLATNILGAKYTVVHPLMPKEWEGESNRELRVSKNIEFYNSLKPLSIKYDVKIAIENMFGTPSGIGTYNETACSRYEEMLDIFNGLNDSEHFCFCLDTGHANITFKDKMLEAIKALGKNIEIVHLHDNNGGIDWHRTPGYGNVDWNMVMPALIEYGNIEVYDFELIPTDIGLIDREAVLFTLHTKLQEFGNRFLED